MTDMPSWEDAAKHWEKAYLEEKARAEKAEAELAEWKTTVDKWERKSTELANENEQLRDCTDALADELEMLLDALENDFAASVIQHTISSRAALAAHRSGQPLRDAQVKIDSTTVIGGPLAGDVPSQPPRKVVPLAMLDTIASRAARWNGWSSEELREIAARYGYEVTP